MRFLPSRQPIRDLSPRPSGRSARRAERGPPRQLGRPADRRTLSLRFQQWDRVELHNASRGPQKFECFCIQHAVWLYLRFTLSYRDVEELLAERGLGVSYETVRSWVLKFGPIIARRLRCGRPRPSNRWHLDEMVVRIAGKHMYLWRAVDDEGEVLEILVQRRRDK
jgi:hypothetical protein